VNSPAESLRGEVQRFYDWARLELAEPGRTGWGRWLLVRRHVDDVLPLLGAGGHAADGAGPRRGARWVVEEGFAQGKGQVGLDHYEVRRYSAWYRHVTLALLAHAFLAVTRAIVAKGKGAAVASAPDRGCCR
jgi:hypothetical protein